MLSSLRNLAKTALLTLHIDVRCGILFQLRRSLRGPNGPSLDQNGSQPPRDSTALLATDSGQYEWVLSEPPASASPLILDLNTDLISFDTNTSTYLGKRERAFIANGLAKLIDRVLVVEADYIQVMNEFGAQRMGLDILVLQQNLRNLTISSEMGQMDASLSGTGDSPLTEKDTTDDQAAILSMSAQFFDLFLQGPEKVMAFVRRRKGQDGGVGYTYDELRVLIELCFSARLRSPDREESVRAKRSMQDTLLLLGELMWDS